MKKIPGHRRDAAAGSRIDKNFPKALQLAAGQHRLCGCRGSAKWPNCDGNKANCERQALELDLREPRFVWMCQCGRSTDKPFCDGDGHLLTTS